MYNTDGSLKAAREMHMLEGFDAAGHGLKQARVVVYMGLIFINCDPDAADFNGPLQNLNDQLGPMTWPVPNWPTSRPTP